MPVDRRWSLARLLSPFLSPGDEADFGPVRGRTHLYVKGEVEKVSGLFGWDELNRLLTHHRLAPSRLRLVQGRREIDRRDYLVGGRSPKDETLDVPGLYGALEAGATLNLNRVEDMAPAVGELAAGLASAFSTRPQVNLYASWGTQEGFGAHWDDHDVFVVQIAGAKQWRVFGMTRAHPLYRDAEHDETPPPRPVWQGEVSAGDVLYLPRGCWHDAVGGGDAALHLTVGIAAPTAIDLMTWIVDDLRTDERFRCDLPWHGEEGGDLAAQLGAALTDRLRDDPVARYLDHRKATLTAPPRPSLPFGPATPEFSGRERLRFAGWTHAGPHHNRERGTVTVRAMGKSWTFSDRFAGVLEALLSGGGLTPVELADFAGPFVPKEELHQAVARLLREGFLFIEPP